MSALEGRTKEPDAGEREKGWGNGFYGLRLSDWDSSAGASDIHLSDGGASWENVCDDSQQVYDH